MKFFSLLLLLAPMLQADSLALRAGVARVEITPAGSMPMYGYNNRKCGPSNGTHDPLFAKALVLQAGDLHGCRMTSGPSIRKDLERVGATWVDQDVVRDGAFVTSRGPDDLPAFNREMIRLFAQVRERSTEMRKAY